ncbi:MAG: DUF4270 family protein [Bacteroidota bacterium]
MFVALFVASCSEETVVGSGLLGDEDLTIDFEEDFVLSAQTVDAFPVVTYFPSNYTVNRHLVGQVNDPLFGESRASVVLAPFAASTPDFEGAVFDSAVLSLSIDSTFLYGGDNPLFDVSIHRVTEQVPNDSFLSTQVLAFDEGVIAERRFALSHIDSVNVPVVGVEDVFDSTLAVPYILTMTLDQEFGQELFDAGEDLGDTDMLQSLFAGIRVSATSQNGLFAVSIPPATFGSQRSSILMYYRDEDGISRAHVLPFGGIQPLLKQFEHDVDSSPISDIIDLEATGEQPMYVKGMGGVKTRIDISDVKRLENALINHASIEFFVANRGSRDTASYPEAIILSLQKETDGILEDIVDVTAGRANSQIGAIYGGSIERDEALGVDKYVMNITTHVKDILKGQETGIIYLSPLDEVEQPETAILLGPDHPVFPAKLKVTFTNP